MLTDGWTEAEMKIKSGIGDINIRKSHFRDFFLWNYTHDE